MLKSITFMFSSVLCLDKKDSELIVQMCSLVWVIAVQIRLISLHSFQRNCLGVFSDKSGNYISLVLHKKKQKQKKPKKNP